MMQDLHAITVPIFARQEDCQFFSGRLCTPESSLRHAQKMKRKVPRRSAVVIMITQIFPTHALHPPCGTCTLPVRYAFALAHRAISAIRRAVGLRLIQTSTGDWTKPGQWAKESVLRIRLRLFFDSKKHPQTLVSVGSHYLNTSIYANLCQSTFVSSLGDSALQTHRKNAFKVLSHDTKPHCSQVQSAAQGSSIPGNPAVVAAAQCWKPTAIRLSGWHSDHNRSP